MRWLLIAAVVFAELNPIQPVQAQALSINDRLITAVLRRDAPTVAALLEQGASADLGVGRGVTILMLAASATSSRLMPRHGTDIAANESIPDRERDDIPVMELLVAHGALVNARDEFGHTALWWATAFANKISNTRFLIEHHADVNAADREGVLLIAAVARSRDPIPMILALLAAHADANARDENGRPLIMWATLWGNIPLVQALLAAGAHPDASEKDSKTALMTALQAGRPELVQLLIDAGADVNAQDSKGNTPLLAVLDKGDKTLVQNLLKSGAHVGGNAGVRALLNAAIFIKTDALRALLAGGGNPNALNPDEPGNKTILMRASQYRHVEPLEILVEYGANVNATDSSGGTALLWAALEDNNAAVLSFLVKKGALVNAQEKDFGNTPLMLAAANGYVENVKVLLDAGADVSIKTKAGADALNLSMKNNRTAVVELLQKVLSRN